MEPLRDRSGEPCVGVIYEPTFLSLQWSRCVIAAESRVTDVLVPAAQEASMEPLRDRSGEHAPLVLVLGSRLGASMEPLRDRSGESA